ncbi:hypothetical protein FAD_0241 [Ferroplasma acidiphilum]|jgi:uncharacterized protein YeaO (DUF488 family)|uniref:Uroporphyrin-III C-methyltransferase n=4 Tax=Ferroplasma TaxID=74968 RepID=S0AR12_FERAC|nr:MULTISPECIES: DUF488 domain-containing protein [Ferroplasma]AGO61207.1 hypothetical protein FACI_IFERC00001G1227 [Ferroplasma acidarmanus Fer1]ARD84165.1 hypothetical protein FAD_0241 [Ferroplasma acidiphilum]HII81692.1 DUF488 domain-containing protein [Ferroplasma sp.]
MIYIKRIYDKYTPEEGFRVLVERLWPRGISKEKAHIDLWMKDIAPSTELRKWFNHEDEKWEEFVKRYTIELSGNEEIGKLKELVKEHTKVTFVYSARNVEHNSAVALKNIVESIDSHIS